MGGLLAEFNSLEVSNKILYRNLVLRSKQYFPYNVKIRGFNQLSYRSSILQQRITQSFYTVAIFNLPQYRYIFVSRVIYYVRDLRETRIYYQHCIINQNDKIHLQHRIVYIIVIYIFCTLLIHTNTQELILIPTSLSRTIKRVRILFLCLLRAS